MRRRLGWLASSAIAALVAVVPNAQAQQASDTWTFSASPYVWFSGISGTVNVGSREASTSASFGDILGNMQFAFMGTAEARYGRFAILGDLIYLSVSQDVTPRSSAYSGGNTSMQNLGLGLAALYRVVEDPAGTLDVGVGIRPWWIDTTVNLHAGAAPARSSSASVTWADPIIAIRGNLRLTDRFSVSGYGDIGGFGVGSRLTWQVLGSLDWRFSDRVVMRAGWRHMVVEPTVGQAQMNLTISGPIIGATIRF